MNSIYFPTTALTHCEPSARDELAIESTPTRLASRLRTGLGAFLAWFGHRPSLSQRVLEEVGVNDLLRRQ